MASIKRESDDDSEEPPSKMSRQDSDDNGSKSGGRNSRVRKKSAKVLEMEEFEEIEKKQFTKKSDSKGKAAATPPGTGAKKVKGKPGQELISPVAAASLTADALTAGMVMPGGSLVQEPVLSPTSPVKASTKQAIGARVRETQQQGSVIKLLLSSPAIPTTPTLTTNVITKTSPPMSVSSAGVTVTPAPAPKKAMVKVKSEPVVKQEPGAMMMEEEELMNVPIKSELMDPQAGHIMLSASLAPDTMTISTPQAFIKTEPGMASTESLGSLKLKLMMSPKDSPALETVVPTSGPIPTMFATNPDETDGPSKISKKSAGGSATKKKAAPKKKKPAGEKAQKKSTKSAAEQMPNLAALVSTPKLQKAVKEERNSSISDGMDTSLSDTSLDMSTIVESALDMEEEAALVIAEVGVGPSKPKKKKASGGGKKKSKAQAASAMEMAGMDSDEGLSAQPEGDIAALAAKVQRSSGAAGGKKKLSKKSLELQEALEKRKRPSRRAPTAYMLYCNSQRPKVVAESPGIDFAQISRTLGVMWQCLSKKEKMMWRRKSKKLAGKGSTLISTGKGNKRGGDSSNMAAAVQASAVPASAARPATSSKSSKPSAAAALPAMAGDDTPQSPVKGFGIEPIDIAAHLKLLGESLSIIGNRLQEHKGLIAVQGSLSVLLDSMLCACGPLLALTHQVPGLDGCSEATHARTLDSVAYIMPGL
ncbi:HMG domain-containing protein 4-like isoform X2 [Littorina saxatilis]|uniref:HMG box domain-containing protein n=1 Tax=Littorina saxatilis TaxID=31220 RepID=A0AAN9B778_9CAEN